jgi:hypothetical protein
MKILREDETTGIDLVEATEFSKALGSSESYIMPQIGRNIEKMEGVPDRINALPIELLGIYCNPHYYTKTPVYIDHPGTGATSTNTFNLTEHLAALQYCNEALVLGIELNIRFAGPDSSLATGFTVAATGIAGTIAVDTQIVAKDRTSATGILLFTGTVDGQSVLNPAKVGVHMDPAVVGVLATAPSWTGADLEYADKTVVVGITGGLNKVIRITLINGAYRAGASHLAQMINRKIGV